MAEITLGQIRNTNFLSLYHKLIKEADLSEIEIQGLYKLALIFMNKGNIQVKKLGYKILLKTSFYENNHRPLYDVSLNLGYYPVTKFIDNFEDGNNHFLNLFMSAFLDNYKDGNIYLTEQQKEMINIFEEKNTETLAIIAPTSYGKSQLIINCISTNVESNICILVPTKALLAQTKRRILNSKIYETNRKIITHPDMFQETDNNFIAVLTQERLLRLLEKHKDLSFGIAIIDEAHNLFEDDYRSRLLATAIAVLNKRSESISFKFLSPFLINSKNLDVVTTNYKIIENKVSEHLKIDSFYFIDFRTDKALKLYDQFLDNTLVIGDVHYETDIDFITEKSNSKSIVYVNSPPKLEAFAIKLKDKRATVASDKIMQACKEIAAYLHEDYSLLDCLKHGVVYHHGSVPDIVKLYIENLFTIEEELKFIVTSSTLLEGVNIPAEKLFLMDYRKGRRKLTPSQFKNLSGRVCRFSEIFNTKKGNLNLLLPEIFVISSNCMPKKANIEKFLKDSVKEDKVIKDKLTNVLLENTAINAKNKRAQQEAEEFLGNFEAEIITTKNYRKATTEIGKLCFSNNITEIKIIDNESKMQKKIEDLLKNDTKAVSAVEVIDMIDTVFLDFITENENNQNIIRLQNEKARSFYAMFLDWRMRSAPYSELISRFVGYWNRITQNIGEAYIYVGKWGNKKRGGHRELWIDLHEKSKTEKINLAIIRIKEEQDFIDNIIVKFIEILNDLELIESDIYKKIKYGTSDENKILMIKNGYSTSLANLLLEKYQNYLSIDLQTNTVIAKSELIPKMNENSENGILVFEATFNVKRVESQ